jgi:O-antigen ligase
MEKNSDKGVFLVILAALAGMFPVTVFSIGQVDVDVFKIVVVVACFFYFITSALKGDFDLPKESQLPILLVMFSWFLLSGLWASNIYLSLSHSFVFSLFIIFFLIVLLFTRTRNDLYRWIYCLPITVFVALVYDLGYLRAHILLRQADKALINNLGVAAGISILPVMFIFLFNKKLVPRLFSLVTFTACGLALMLSASRGGLLVVIFNIAILTLLLWRSAEVRRLGITFVIVLAVPIVVLATSHLFIEAKDVFIARWRGTFNPDFLYAGTTSYYWEENPRLELWHAAIKMFESKPILGVGFGAFRQEIAIINPSLSYWTFPHNTYLAILSETGIVGFVVFSALIGICLNNYRVTTKYLRTKGSSEDYFLVTTIKVSFWGLLLYCALRPALFEFPLYLFMALSQVSRTALVRRNEAPNSN